MQKPVGLKCRCCGLWQYDWRRSDKGAGEQIFLAKRTMRRIVGRWRLAMAGLRKGGTARQSRGCVNMCLGNVAGLRESDQRERKNDPAPDSTKPVYAQDARKLSHRQHPGSHPILETNGPVVTPQSGTGRFAAESEPTYRRAGRYPKTERASGSQGSGRDCGGFRPVCDSHPGLYLPGIGSHDRAALPAASHQRTGCAVAANNPARRAPWPHCGLQ
jgi:hypothetical protein